MQTKQSYFKLLCKKLRENGKLLVDGPRDMSRNVSKCTNSTASSLSFAQKSVGKNTKKNSTQVSECDMRSYEPPAALIFYHGPTL